MAQRQALSGIFLYKMAVEDTLINVKKGSYAWVVRTTGANGTGSTLLIVNPESKKYRATSDNNSWIDGFYVGEPLSFESFNNVFKSV